MIVNSFINTQSPQKNMKKNIIIIILPLLLLFISCKNDNTNIHLIASTELCNQINEDCNNYLVEMIKSSTFPFEAYKVKKEDIHLLVDEEDETTVQAKVFFETNGSGTLGWINYNKKEKKLYNTSANLENPEQLDFDIQWLQRYDDCVQTYSSKSNNAIQADSKENCTSQSNIQLPYAQNHKNITDLLVLDCPIKNSENWLCDSEKLRYKPLFSKNSISVILVPQDCGDFTYRFYLLTIKDNEIVSDLYAEGEWYEPGDEDNKEFTSFTVQNDSTISILIKNQNGEVGVDYNQDYSIDSSGTLVAL